jgi:hypothetical protein
MDQLNHSKIDSFIWGIADDVLRDLFKRGKYPDVILPMCVLRRIDAVLGATKKAVPEAKEVLDRAGITEQRSALCAASKQAFYSTSRFILRDLKSGAGQQQLKQDFEDYLVGFSPNVQDILDNLKFRNQIPTLSEAEAIGALIEKFPDPEINLSPDAMLNGDGSAETATTLQRELGDVSLGGLKLSARTVSRQMENAAPAVAKVFKPGKDPDRLHGPYAGKLSGKRAVVEYEPDPDLRDTEQAPLLEAGGIEAFFRQEVLPHSGMPGSNWTRLRSRRERLR